MKRRYRVLRFDGDDIYSWAVFRAEDVKGHKGVVFYGQAKPVVCGLSRSQAQFERDEMEKWR